MKFESFHILISPLPLEVFGEIRIKHNTEYSAADENNKSSMSFILLKVISFSDE